MDIPFAEQIAEVQRELALRRKCYPQWIKAGTLDPGDAKYQMQCLEAVLKTLRLVDVAQRQLSLFPGPEALPPP